LLIFFDVPVEVGRAFVNFVVDLPTKERADMATQEEKNWRNKYRVGRTFIPEHKLLVSTVLLLHSERRSREYETMVFHADKDGKLKVNFTDLLCLRSDTRKEARANHKRVVEQLRLGWFYRESESADAWQAGRVVLIGAN
jgi:hypothetical protein